jgi:GT2 family glycosyltransferase
VKRVYVVLVNWNGWADTIECLESLMCMEGGSPWMVVCDNGSNDESVERIRAWAEGRLVAASPGSPLECVRQHTLRKPISWVEYDRQEAEAGGDLAADPQLVIVRTGTNLGFAGGNNVGLRYALARDDFDYVWLLNNDTVVEPKALAAMISRMAEKSTAGMCGSTLIRYHEPQRIEAFGGGYYCKWIGLPWHVGRTRRTDQVPAPRSAERLMNYVVGASLMVSRQFLKEIGLMNEEYFLYFEETDWAVRARGRFGLAYAPDSIVYHKIGQSIGTTSDPRKKSLLCDFFALRNRIKFTRKYYAYALPAIYISVLTAFVVRIMCRRWSHAAMAWDILLGRDARWEMRGMEHAQNIET